MIFVEYYLPGFKAGGPLRSIGGLVSDLGDQFDFRIVTRCHDDGETAPYHGIGIDEWNQVGRAQVWYASDRGLTVAGLAGIMRQSASDIIYLNGCFGPMMIRVLLARRLGLAGPRPTIVAPRGEFSAGALLLKGTKKRLFLWIARHAGLFTGITWQASTSLEEADIRTTVGADATVKVAADVVMGTVPSPIDSRPAKRPGAARFVFLSRITRKKNLDFALQLLSSLDGDITVDIYGPIGDAAYWRQCEECIRRLPGSVHAAYRGVVPHHAVAGVLARAHFFILPTRGENFGHVILEALTVGCPPLVSDQTPWFRSENAPVTWSIPLDDVERWRQELQRRVGMDQDEYRVMSAFAQQFAQIETRKATALAQNKMMLDEVLSSSQPANRDNTPGSAHPLDRQHTA
jgi:glycosyltransferase involved in cell wall biosynthesis